jgi:hypothetical protein
VLDDRSHRQSNRYNAFKLRRDEPFHPGGSIAVSGRLAQSRCLDKRQQFRFIERLLKPFARQIVQADYLGLFDIGNHDESGVAVAL